MRVRTHREARRRWTLIGAFAFGSTMLLACTSATVSLGGDSGVPIRCAGIECAQGEICCYASGQCFDPVRDEAACPRPPLPATGEIAGAPCAADSHCSPAEYCQSTRCLGVGFCASRTNTGFCWAGPGPWPRETPGGPEPSPGPGTPCEVCGCDGATYDALQIAGQAGVRLASAAACGTPDPGGVVGCATSVQCPPGAECCSLNGHCFDPMQPWRCTLQPDGTLPNCSDNNECGADDYCASVNGCDTPGVCTRRPTDCTDPAALACGCDGRTYQRPCDAASNGIRIAHDGECP